MADLHRHDLVAELVEVDRDVLRLEAEDVPRGSIERSWTGTLTAPPPGMTSLTSTHASKSDSIGRTFEGVT